MLSVALLISAGLLLRSFWKVQQVKPGFEPIRPDDENHAARSREERCAWAFYSRLLSEIKSLLE
jgi:hypothetical protein